MSARALFSPRALALVLAVAGWSCVDGTPTDVLASSVGVPLQFAVVSGSNLSTDETDALNKAFDVIDEIRVRLFRPGETTPFIDTLVAVQPGKDEYAIDIAVPGAETGQTLDVALAGSAGGVELFSAKIPVKVKRGSAPGGGDTTTGDDQIISLPVRYSGPGLSGTVVDPDGLPAPGVEVELVREGAVVKTATTSVLGEYLFTDLGGGVYTVRVRTIAGITSCPASREIGPLDARSKIVGGFRLSRTNCELRILVLSGGDFDDTGGVAGSLGAMIPEATFGTHFVVVNPPSLSSLLQYDAVVLFGNGTYDHATRVGNRIAEYIGAGGNVVIGSFYWQNRSDGGYGHPGWGALEGLDPFTASSGAARYGPGTLGSTTPHPITEGVGAFSVARWWGGVSAKGGTSVVASWSDGTPLAGYNIQAGGQRIVAISAFPGLMGSAGGNLSKLWGNAVRWAGSAGGPASLSPGR